MFDRKFCSPHGCVATRTVELIRWHREEGANREGRTKPGLRPLVSLRIVGRVILTGPSALDKPKDRREGRPKPGLRP